MPPSFDKVWEDARLIEGDLRREDARAIYATACGVPPEQMIVEVGCRRGRGTAVLAESGRKVWTVDPMIDVAPENMDALRRNLLPYPRVIWKRQTVAEVGAPLDAVGMLLVNGDEPLRAFERFEPYLVIAGKVIFRDASAASGLVAQNRLRIIGDYSRYVVCVKARESYSQGGEDVAAQDFFGGETGRFLDVGAWDGVDKSNTRLLAEEGWSGVCVEPAVKPFDKLVCHYAGFHGIELVHAAIMPRRGLLRFWDTADALSSFDERHVGVWRENAGVPFREIWSPTITFADLFAALPGKYDYVNLDAEGHSVDLLEAFDPLRVGTRLVCVEHDGRLDDITKWAERYGFRRVVRTNENVLIGRDAA